MSTSCLLFGADGWIGGQLVPHLRDAGLTVESSRGVRADDAAGVRELLDAVKPDRVVSVIGRTRGPANASRGVASGTIDYLEDVEKEHGKLVMNLRDNLYGPMTLALACAERGIHFTYLGTGCIFEYLEGAPEAPGFDEDADPNFFGSAYSVVKGFTDRLMRQCSRDVLQARIRMPITADMSPHNFVTKIVSYDRICSVENSMTVLPTLLPILADMVARRAVGTVNLTNPGTLSHDRVLAMYRDIVDPGFTWTNFTIAEQDAVLRSKRSNNRLDTAKLTAMYPDVPDVATAVERCLRGMFLLRLVHHLTVVHRANILDVTKCSTTARNVYNYLCAPGEADVAAPAAAASASSGGGAMPANNNLADVEPNLADLEHALLDPRGTAFVTYVHFDHLTNDTSHYFIVMCSGGTVVVLQSAVFEFSIRDWLFPEQARAELLGGGTEATAEPTEPADASDASEAMRLGFAREQAARDRARGAAVLDSIAECRWSGGKTSTTEAFARDFLPALASLEGTWREDDVAARSATYRRLFACRLQEDVVRAAVRTGFDKPARVKVHLRPLRNLFSHSDDEGGCRGLPMGVDPKGPLH